MSKLIKLVLCVTDLIRTLVNYSCVILFMETSWLVWYSEIIAMCPEVYRNTLCGQNLKLFYF